jgi:hypothetical protein
MLYPQEMGEGKVKIGKIRFPLTQKLPKNPETSFCSDIADSRLYADFPHLEASSAYKEDI